MMTDKEKRERMAAQPFAPISHANAEYRSYHAQEYAAFYLGEIEKHLGRIATLLENGNFNGAKIVSELQDISKAVLRSKM
jgi:hypothetical protein